MKSSRNQQDIESLQEILTRYVDSIFGFKLASDFSSDSAFIRVCCLHAETREADAEELASVIAAMGGKPELGGSYEARLHRAWMSFFCQTFPRRKGTLLNECLRGERGLLATVTRLLRDPVLNLRARTVARDLHHDVTITIARLEALRDNRKSEATTLPYPQPH